MPCISRIAKLLEAEFVDLVEPVLAESPFTEVTAEGLGIRQFHIGLTSSKLLFAADNFDRFVLNSADCRPFPRPECETLTLVKIVPLYEVRVRFCAKNGRHVMNIWPGIKPGDKIALEMGGHFYKNFLWHEFWLQIACRQFLTPTYLLSCNEFCCTEDGASSSSSYTSVMANQRSNLQTDQKFQSKCDFEKMKNIILILDRNVALAVNHRCFGLTNFCPRNFGTSTNPSLLSVLSRSVIRSLMDYLLFPKAALTNSKLIFACDDFDEVDVGDFGYHIEPPETETLIMVSFMPLQALKINFYRQNGRRIMRVTTLDDDRPMFFEIGGHMYQNLFWNTFREQVSCLHEQSPSLWHLNGDSPFASTAVLEDDFICEAHVHANPSASSSSTIFIACRGYYSA